MAFDLLRRQPSPLLPLIYLHWFAITAAIGNSQKLASVFYFSLIFFPFLYSSVVDLRQLNYLYCCMYSMLVVPTSGTGIVLGSGSAIDRVGLCWTCTGTMMVAASANSLNQANMLAAGLAASNLIIYAFVYTPLKQIHPINTWVGDIVGAIPPLLGWTVACGLVSLNGMVLPAALYFWQIPHFMALAYMCCNDYAAGGRSDFWMLCLELSLITLPITASAFSFCRDNYSKSQKDVSRLPCVSSCIYVRLLIDRLTHDQQSVTEEHSKKIVELFPPQNL